MTTKLLARRAVAAFAMSALAVGGGALAPTARAATASEPSAVVAKGSQAQAAVGWMDMLRWRDARTQACGRPVSTTSGDAIWVFVRTDNRKGTSTAGSQFTTVNHGEPGPNNWKSTRTVAPGQISDTVSRSFHPNHRAYYMITSRVGGVGMRMYRVDNLPLCPDGVGN